jgi:S1-C subfamily serine protease
MTIVPAGHPQGSAAVVGGVALQGTAHTKGVRKGDRVVAVDGNEVRSFDALEASLAAIGRPVTFRLERAVAVAAAAAVPVAAAGPMSPQDREREARRAAMAAAAEERTKAWTRKIEGNRCVVAWIWLVR